MPVVAGRTVNVLGVATVNCEDESLHQHKSFPAVVPVEFLITANLIFAIFAPDAVNAIPIADIVNFICLALAGFTIHCPVAGTKALPPATYPAADDSEPPLQCV